MYPARTLAVFSPGSVLNPCAPGVGYISLETHSLGIGTTVMDCIIKTMIKKVGIGFLVALTIAACKNPKSKINQSTLMSYSNKLTPENFVVSVENKVKHFSVEPYYYLFVSNRDCYYEILVNDLPVTKYYNEGQQITPIEINWAINKSGKQKVTYKLHPINYLAPEKNKASFSDVTELTIQVFHRNKANKEDPFASEEKVTEIITPKKKNGEGFISQGQTSYEYSFYFDADVPYVNKAWEHSKDLTKMNPNDLLAKTVKAYEEIWNVLDKKNDKQYFKMIETKSTEVAQSRYDEKDDITFTKESIMHPFSIRSYRMQPLQNYKMVLYGNGKLVCLELQSQVLRERGRSALWAKYYNDHGSVTGTFIKVYLRIPEGQDSFEIIR